MYFVKNPQKRSCCRRNVIVVITLIVTLSIVTLYYVYKTNSYATVMLNAVDMYDISCHIIEEGDMLRSAEDQNFVPRPNSIFFHETSCRGGLNSRQACSVESAARAHPMTEIHVLFSGPVSKEVYQGNSISKLTEFQNIKFARVHMKEYGKHTPLEAFLSSDPFKDSVWRIEHISDVLRYVTLYKWGGIYLDLDMVVVKSLSPLGHNWFAKQNDYYMTNAAFAMSMDQLGRRLSSAIIDEVKSDYRPDIWSYNGPLAVARMLNKICDTDTVANWSSIICQGTEIYGPEYFYPVGSSMRDDYFKPGDLKRYKSAYTHHFWNKFTYYMKIEKDSLYANIARQFCPTIYEMYGEEFGN